MDSVLEDITEVRSQIRRFENRIEDTVNKIEDAEKVGKPEAYILILNQQLAGLNQQLVELMKKENILLERQSGQS